MQQSDEELEQLLNAIIPFAQRMLSRHGEFYPFAAAVSRDGRLKFIGEFVGDAPVRENPLAAELIGYLREQLIDGASKGEFRATGLCSGAQVDVSGQNEKSDAVRISVEHLDGRAMNVFLPYRLDSAGEVLYGDVFATAAEAVIFLRGFND